MIIDIKWSGAETSRFRSQNLGSMIKEDGRCETGVQERILYGTETWAMIKEEEEVVERTEMRMFKIRY